MAFTKPTMGCWRFCRIGYRSSGSQCAMYTLIITFTLILIAASEICDPILPVTRNSLFLFVGDQINTYVFSLQVYDSRFRACVNWFLSRMASGMQPATIKPLHMIGFGVFFCAFKWTIDPSVNLETRTWENKQANNRLQLKSGLQSTNLFSSLLWNCRVWLKWNYLF